MAYKKVKYTGEGEITSLVGPAGVVEWKKGDWHYVIESKVHNHVKYPHFELVTEEEVKEVVKKEVKKEKEEVVEETPKKKIVKKSK